MFIVAKCQVMYFPVPLGDGGRNSSCTSGLWLSPRCEWMMCNRQQALHPGPVLAQATTRLVKMFHLLWSGEKFCFEGLHQYGQLIIWSSHYCAANLLDFSIRMCTSLVWTKEHSIKTHFHLILSTFLMPFLFGAMDASHQEMTIWVPKSIYGAMLNQPRDYLSAVCFRL